MTDNILKRLRPELGSLSAYKVAPSEGYVKLDAMENPYQWSEELNQQWLNHLSHAAINRYPDPDPESLKHSLQKQFGPRDENIQFLLGNGSDELIQLLVLAIARPGASVLTVSPSFSMYQIISEMLGVSCHSVALDKHYEIDLEAMLSAIKTHDPSLIFLAYPNNPTGNLWSRADLQTIIEASRGIVVIDEAYGPFASDSFVDDLRHYPHVVLLRTASKLGLAGLRFGWLAGHASLIGELNKLRLPYNINLLTQLTMQFALDHYNVLAEQAAILCQDRDRLTDTLTAMSDIQVYPSEANFLLFKVNDKNVDDVFSQLLASNILIKNVSHQAGLADCLRVTVGTEAENQEFVNALSEALTQRT